MESGDPDQPAVRDAQDLRTRCLADGYLPAEIEGLNDDDLASLLAYEDESTMEACAERLPNMTVWQAGAASERNR